MKVEFKKKIINIFIKKCNNMLELSSKIIVMNNEFTMNLRVSPHTIVLL